MVHCELSFQPRLTHLGALASLGMLVLYMGNQGTAAPHVVGRRLMCFVLLVATILSHIPLGCCPTCIRKAAGGWQNSHHIIKGTIKLAAGPWRALPAEAGTRVLLLPLHFPSCQRTDEQEAPTQD